jgi:hypothetical protein
MYNQTSVDGQPFALPRRDSQRGKCYAAEKEAFGKEFRRLFLDGNIDDIQEMVNSITEGAHWRNLTKRMAVVRTSVRIERMHSHSGRACAGATYVKLSHSAESLPIILHELAHCATDYASKHHFPWAAAYLELVREHMGDFWAEKLRSSFVKHRVKFRKGQGLSWFKYKEKHDEERRRLV